MEDDVPIQTLVEQANNKGLNLSYKRNNNPFKIPDSAELFGFREIENKRHREARSVLQQMSLVQRADLQKPVIPPCVTRSTKLASSSSKLPSSRSIVSSVPLDISKYERRQRMAEFIQQKREIFLMQLLIDKKNAEIQKINKKISDAEATLAEDEIQIGVSSTQYKLETAQIETNLAKARKATETATRERVTKLKDLKYSNQNVAIMKSEITKNEDNLDTYRVYRDFLQQFLPEDATIEGYFDSPNKLLAELNKIEQGNLMIIEQCQQMEDVLLRGTKDLNEDIYITDEAIEKIVEELETKNLENGVPDPPPPFNQDQLERREDEMTRLTNLIINSYTNCFGKIADVNPLIMLEKIEIELEKFYKEVEYIKPSFVAEKQALIDKDRREQQRKDKQLQQLAEQKLKMEQAIERANKPIKKHTGRPLYARGYMSRVDKKQDAKLLAQIREQQRIENLLYGSPYE